MGVITHLEPDILECKVKWALESITTNKASGGDGIPVELFQILKCDAMKVLHSICQQIWKTQQWQWVFITILNKKKIANILWIHDIEFFISKKVLYPLIKVLTKEMLYLNLEHWKYSMLLNKLCQSRQDKYISNYCEYFRNKPF